MICEWMCKYGLFLSPPTLLSSLPVQIWVSDSNNSNNDDSTLLQYHIWSRLYHHKFSRWQNMARKYLPIKHKCYKGLPNSECGNSLMAQQYAICTPNSYPILQTMRRDLLPSPATASQNCVPADSWWLGRWWHCSLVVSTSTNQQIQSLPASVISDFSGPDVPHVVWSPRRDRAACRCGEISVRLRKILEAL